MSTGRLGQRFQSAAHRGPADGVQDSADQQASVLGGAQAQPALLDQVLQGAVKSRGIDRMLVVQNLVVELARRVFQGQRQELRLVEDFGEFLCRVSQGDQVGEADPGLMHCLDALGKLALLFPHRQGVPDRVRVHVAVEADPIGGGVEAFIVPLLTLGKLRRVARELELQAIDEVTQAGEEEALVDSLGNHLEHADSLPN